MWHLGKINHHRLAADILAQGKHQWRCDSIILRGLQYLPEPDHFTMLIRNFQPYYGLAWNNLDNPHTDGRQGPGKVLGKIADLAHLDTRRGLQFKTRDNRPRMYLDHLCFNTKILELQLNLA